MHILKFGGITLSNARNIEKVGHVIAEQHAAQIPFWIVVSAMGTTTNTLLELANTPQSHTLVESLHSYHNTLCRQLHMPEQHTNAALSAIEARFSALIHLLQHAPTSPHSPDLAFTDQVIAYGELLSATLTTHYLQSRGLNCTLLDTRELIRTDDQYGNANVLLPESSARIQAYAAQHNHIPVATGFIAQVHQVNQEARQEARQVTKQGQTTTLGRDGSNMTAAVLGYALNAAEITLWTHVNGVCVLSPDMLPHAHNIAYLSYQEAHEMAYYGASILHQQSIPLIEKKGIALQIKNIFAPQHPGTHISARKSNTPLQGITVKKNIALLEITANTPLSFTQLVAGTFQILEKNRHEALFTMPVSTEGKLVLAAHPDIAEAIQACLPHTTYNVQLRTYFSAISLIGEALREHTSICTKTLQTLTQHGIQLIATAQGASQHSLCIIIPQEQLYNATQALYATFFSPTLRRNFQAPIAQPNAPEAIQI